MFKIENANENVAIYCEKIQVYIFFGDAKGHLNCYLIHHREKKGCSNLN